MDAMEMDRGHDDDQLQTAQRIHSSLPALRRARLTDRQRPVLIKNKASPKRSSPLQPKKWGADQPALGRSCTRREAGAEVHRSDTEGEACTPRSTARRGAKEADELDGRTRYCGFDKTDIEQTDKTTEMASGHEGLEAATNEPGNDKRGGIGWSTAAMAIKKIKTDGNESRGPREKVRASGS